MARELDPDRLKCDAGHGRPVVAFATQGPDPGPGPWFACCPVCLDDLNRYDHFVYVRLQPTPTPADDGSGHDPITTTPDDLKPNHGAADTDSP